ncbi:MAG: 6-phosphogluconate dehydrogenase, NAD-binding [Planctomycetaceae bacterium]|nr:6-phosphogluconate dehydrogenase, NAD-binding [Planctomycetaceae bacterium]
MLWSGSVTVPARCLELPMIPSPCVTTFGLIGLGLMGEAIAARLRDAGHGVLGFDIQPRCSAQLTALGGEVATDAGSVLSACDIVLLSVPSHTEVQALLTENAQRLRRGQLIVDTTTGAPEAAIEIAARLAEVGVSYLDATISGSSAHVRQGDVLWMVGGERAEFERCADLFRCIGREAIYTGPTGSGSKMKLVTNLVLGLNRAALAEGLAFANHLELDATQTLAVFRASAAYSRIMDSKGEKMIGGDFTPVARLSQHLKDVKLILEAGSVSGARLPLSETHFALLEEAEAAGLGQLDNSAIFQVYLPERT